MDAHDIWTTGLSLATLFGGYMLNRVTMVLDKLQEADAKLSQDLNDFKTEYVPKADFLSYIDRLDRRMEAAQSLHMESNKVIFAKLDAINDRMAEKISRAEYCKVRRDDV